MKFVPAFFAFLAMCAPAFSAAPTVTDPVANVPVDGVTKLRATVTTNGGTTTVVFRYGIGATHNIPVSVSLSDSAAVQTAEKEIKGLVGGLDYSFEVSASNADGAAPTVSSALFSVPAYKPTIDLPNAVPSVGGKAKLSVVVTANGGVTDVVFDFGLTTAYGGSKSVTGIAATEQKKTVSVDIDGLERGKTYHWKATATNPLGSSNTLVTVAGVTSDLTFIATANQKPVTKTDSVVLQKDEPLLIDVLANDTDPEGDAITLLAVFSPEKGTAEIVDGKVRYTPRDGTIGSDTFTYSVQDNFLGTSGAGAIATGTIIVRMPKRAADGLNAAVIKDADGNITGIIRVVGNATGSVSGKITLYNDTYAFQGTLDENGRLHAAIPHGSEVLGLDLAFTGDTDTKLTAKISLEGKKFSADSAITTLTKARREELNGSYTLNFPAPGGGTDKTLPGGTGYARIDVKPWGDVRIKGVLGDGTKFSSKGVLGGSDTGAGVTFWLTPGKVRANLVLSFSDDEFATLDGSMDWYRNRSSGADFFPEGFFAQLSPSGARYLPPEDGKRVFATNNKTATIKFSDGDLPAAITHQINISSSNKVTVADPGFDNLKIKIDSKTGVFTGNFEHPFDGDGRKFRGALVQTERTGRGVFLGSSQTGTVEISLGFTATPAPTPAPTPTPVPGVATPTPSPTLPPGVTIPPGIQIPGFNGVRAAR